MGYATEISEDLLRTPITPAESVEHREQELVLREPEATPGGEIVARPAPAVAPAPIYQAAPKTWD
jgi:hypothetical protein